MGDVTGDRSVAGTVTRLRLNLTSQFYVSILTGGPFSRVTSPFYYHNLPKKATIFNKIKYKFKERQGSRPGEGVKSPQSRGCFVANYYNLFHSVTTSGNSRSQIRVPC